MKHVLALVIGGLLALAIACGGAAPKQAKPLPPPPGGERAQIDALDQAITDAMTRLAEPRPAPAAGACVASCGAEPMAASARQAIAPEDATTCKPAQTQTCTDACNLKDSICSNASKICSIAADLGGDDAYANEKCNSGVASCEAARQRCCGCVSP